MPKYLQILLNIAPYQAGKRDRRQILEAWPGARIIENQAETPLEQFNGSGVDVLVSEGIPRNLPAWPKLRFVQLLAAGTNHLDGHPIWKTDIPVATASGAHSVPIAQYITCTLLMMAHRMPQQLEFKSSRIWPDRNSLAGFVVHGLTAGILGYGSIGRECGRQLNALGMRIVALKRDSANRRDDGFNAWPGTGDPRGSIPKRWFGPGQLCRMLPMCDVLIVTAPATPATLGMIGKSEFAMMKKGARVIAASRGGILEEKALAEALRSGHLAGAVVDGYVKEPLSSDHPFFDLSNIILTPHMSGVSGAFWPAMINLLSENLRRFYKRLPPLNPASGRWGY